FRALLSAPVELETLLRERSSQSPCAWINSFFFGMGTRVLLADYHAGAPVSGAMGHRSVSVDALGELPPCGAVGRYTLSADCHSLLSAAIDAVRDRTHRCCQQTFARWCHQRLHPIEPSADYHPWIPRLAPHPGRESSRRQRSSSSSFRATRAYSSASSRIRASSYVADSKTFSLPSAGRAAPSSTSGRSPSAGVD